MSHYHHLTLRDRVFISALTISGKSLSEIACAIEGEENFVGDSEIIALGGASNETKDRPLG